MWDLSYSSQAGSWAFFIKNLFTEIGLAICFEEIMPCDLELVKQQLHNTYQATWNIERYSKPKLRYYNMFKPDLGQEEYLTFNISKHQHSLFPQLGGGILPLQVEIGRYCNLPLKQRICTLCDKNEVEDEFHLAMPLSYIRRHPKSLIQWNDNIVSQFYGNGRSATICIFSQQHSKTSHTFLRLLSSEDEHCYLNRDLLNDPCVCIASNINIALSWHISPNGAGWLYVFNVVYYNVTCHINKDYVMLCYVMLCYVMLCYVMLW